MYYSFDKISALIVESNHEMFDMTKSVLNIFGISRVFPAFDHNKAFNMFCEVKPDIIFMDWLQDPQNALELTRKIRTNETSVNPYIPIVLMSGYTSVKRVKMARDSGITAFMAKPYTAKVLYDKIEQLVERPRQFVKAENYLGPDRRSNSRVNDNYDGTERRTA